MNITKVIVTRHDILEKPKLLATVSIVLDYDFQINNIELKHGEKGEYLTFPHDKVGKFITYPINEDTRLYVLNKILEEYYNI